MPITVYGPARPHPSHGPIVAVHDNTGDNRDDLWRLGFRPLKVSGKRDRGGPGHRVGGYWFIATRHWTDAVRSAIDRINAVGTARNSRELAEALGVQP